MDIKKIKNEIRKEISMWVGNKERVTHAFICERAELYFKQLAEQKPPIVIDLKDRETMINSLSDDYLGFGPLQRFMKDEEVTEVMVNGPYKIYLEKKGKMLLSDAVFDDESHLRYIVEKMISPTGRRVDESNPCVDFSLEDGSRVNIILPPLSVGGITVTMRKFLRSIQNVEDLVNMGTIDQRMGDFLSACIKAKVNILFSGATGSGKTTTLEVLSSYISPDERIVTIEDALELHLRQDHVVKLLTRPANIEGKGEVTPRELFRNTLRMRPTRIILGEVRGEEAMDYLQALNSGHRGCLAVIHASSPQDAITRLETMALYAGLNLPSWAIRDQIASGVDIIVQQEQLIDGSRKITHITEVEALNEDKISTRDIFRYETEEMGEDFVVKGKFRAKSKPTFISLFKNKGIPLDEGIFTES